MVWNKKITLFIVAIILIGIIVLVIVNQGSDQNVETMTEADASTDVELKPVTSTDDPDGDVSQATDEQEDSDDMNGGRIEVDHTVPAQPVAKIPPYGNPLITHKFGADPNGIFFEGRLYIYMTSDMLEYDEHGNVQENSYSTINKLTVISSDDLANWTDHGEIEVAGSEGIAKWATQSWAPAIAHKVIDGKDQFFLYFSNNASNIGVLTSDSPLGPWVAPLRRALINRGTPGVDGVEWVFDPAVLIDDDGKGYLYFGGGVPTDKEALPETARVIALGDDMISVEGKAEVIANPYHFESSGIHKYNGKYYYTYSSNFIGGSRPEGSPGTGEIAYMIADQPMGPWEYGGTILKNPYHFFHVGGNNHQDFVWIDDKLYILYHAQTVAKHMGAAKGYRSTHINEVFFNDDGTMQDIVATYEGVEQLKMLNPYVRVEAETIAWQAGIQTEAIESEHTDKAHDGMIVTHIHHNDWLALSKVDFGDNGGAHKFSAAVSSLTSGGKIELRLGNYDGELIGTLNIEATGGWENWVELTTEVLGTEGIHDLYLVFRGNSNDELFRLDYWQFSK